MTVTGDIIFSGGLNIAGSVKGSVIAEGTDALVDINESGRIDGDVRAPTVFVTVVMPIGAGRPASHKRSRRPRTIRVAELLSAP